MKSLAGRLAIFAMGAIAVLYGLQMWHRGVIVYESGARRFTNFSGGTIALGVFFMLLAFLPPAVVVDRWLTPKKPEHRSHPEHRRHHGAK
jgi:hypothetical protein